MSRLPEIISVDIAFATFPGQRRLLRQLPQRRRTFKPFSPPLFFSRFLPSHLRGVDDIADPPPPTKRTLYPSLPLQNTRRFFFPYSDLFRSRNAAQGAFDRGTGVPTPEPLRLPFTIPWILPSPLSPLARPIFFQSYVLAVPLQKRELPILC